MSPELVALLAVLALAKTAHFVIPNLNKATSLPDFGRIASPPELWRA